MVKSPMKPKKPSSPSLDTRPPFSVSHKIDAQSHHRDFEAAAHTQPSIRSGVPTWSASGNATSSPRVSIRPPQSSWPAASPHACTYQHPQAGDPDVPNRTSSPSVCHRSRTQPVPSQFSSLTSPSGERNAHAAEEDTATSQLRRRGAVPGGTPAARSPCPHSLLQESQYSDASESGESCDGKSLARPSMHRGASVVEVPSTKPCAQENLHAYSSMVKDCPAGGSPTETTTRLDTVVGQVGVEFSLLMRGSHRTDCVLQIEVMNLAIASDGLRCRVL